MNLRDLLKGIQSTISTGANNLKSWGKVISTPQIRQDFTKSIIQPRNQSFNMGSGNLRSLPNMINNKPVNFNVPKTKTTTIKTPKKEIIPGGWEGVKSRLSANWKSATPAGMIQEAPQLASKLFGKNQDVAEGVMRGALDPTGVMHGASNLFNPNEKQLTIPQTQREKTARKVAGTISGTAATLPLGGLYGVATRAVQGTTLGIGMKFVGNALSGKKLTEGLGDAALDGASNSWQLAFTNLAADKIAIKFLPKLAPKSMEMTGKLLKNATSMGMNTTTKAKIFATGAKQLFGRALLESPIENTWFTAMNQMNDTDKRGFLKAWIEDLPGNTAGNLLFAGLAVTKRGTYDFNKPQIDDAVKSLKSSVNKYFKGNKFNNVTPNVTPNVTKITSPVDNVTPVAPVAPVAPIIKVEPNQTGIKIKTGEITPLKQELVTPKIEPVANTDALQTINDAIKSGDIEGARNLHETFSQETQLPKFEDMVAQNKVVTPEINNLQSQIDKTQSDIVDIMQSISKDGGKANTSTQKTNLLADKKAKLKELYNQQSQPEIITPKINEQLTGDEVVSKLKEMGTQGGLNDFGGDFLLKTVAKENYTKETVNINDLLAGDVGLKEYIDATKGKIRSHKGTTPLIPPIVTSKGEVWDGFNRIAQAVKNGETTIEILKGVDATQTPIVAPKTSSNANLDELNKISQDIQSNKASAEINSQTRNQYETGEISLFNQVKKMMGGKSYQEGDIETLRTDPSKAKTIQLATETVMAKNPNIKDEQGALDFIQNFPTASSTKTIAGPISQKVIDIAYKSTLENGGVTISIKGNQPTEGFAYAPFKGTETVVDKGSFTKEHVDAFGRQHVEELNQPGNNIGIWEDGGKIFMDISRVGDPNSKTLQEAINAQQLGAFDLGSLKTGEDGNIPLGEIKDGVYNQLYEATNIPYLNRGQNNGTNISGDLAGIPKVSGSVSESSPTGQGGITPDSNSNTPNPSLKPIPGPGEGIQKLPVSMAESLAIDPVVADAAYGIYKKKPNDVTMAQADNILKQQGYEEARKIAFGTKIDSPEADVANVLGIRLLQEAQKIGNYDEAIAIAREISKRATLGGRATQVWAILGRLTPEGMLKYAQKEIDAAGELQKNGVIQELTGIGRSKGKDVRNTSNKITIELTKANSDVLDEVGNDINSRFGGQMKVAGTESVPSQTTAGKAGAPEQTISTGKTKTGVVFKGKKSGVEVTQGKIDGVEVSIDPEKSLAKRIKNYVSDPKDKKKDPIREMVNTLFTIAKKSLPEKVKKAGNDPMEVIANAIKNKEEYKSVWNESKKVLEAKYGKNSEVMGKIEEFLKTELNKPFPEEKLNAEVGKAINANEINIGELVKKYYLEVGNARQTLSDYLVEKAGLNGTSAKELESYVQTRFDELTSAKKNQILENLLKPKIKNETVRKDIIQKMIEYSNLGGFDNQKYYDEIAKKLNIPVMDNDLAKIITENMQKIQGMEDGDARDNIIRDTLYAINKKIGIKAGEKLTAFRYQNILSGLGTQMRNTFQNTVQTTILRPSQLGTQSIIEFGRKVVNPEYERKVFFSDVPKYYADLVAGLPEGIAGFQKAWKGIRDVSSPDITAHKSELLPKALTFVSDFMEAQDKFFQGAGANAETQLNLRHGMDAESAKAEGVNKAAELLFRKPLDPENLTGQGDVLAFVDRMSMGLQQLRDKAPALRWFIPFISTPMNVAKQWIEYTPGLGAFTAIGNKDVSAQFSKQMIGSFAMAVGALAAGQGNTTWEAPKDPKEKELWYASGRKPYSVKVGNQWIPMNYMGVLYPAFAIPAAVRDKFIDGQGALADSTQEKLLGVVSGMVGAYADQTFLTGLSNWVKVMTGDTNYSTPSQLAFTAEQVVPLSGAIRWINTIIDPRYIEAKGFLQSIQKDIPGLSKSLPAYQTPIGEDSMRDVSNSFKPYATGIQNDIYEAPLSMRSAQLQENAVTNKMKKEAENTLKTSNDAKKGTNTDTATPLTIDDKKLKAVAYTFGLDKVMVMPDSTNLEQVAKRQEAFKVVDKVLDSEYPDEVKSQLYQAIGLDEGTAKYYNVARENVEYRTALVAERLQSAQSQEEATKILTDGMMPINSKKIVTDDVITALQKQGIIGEGLAKYLKKLEWDPQTGTVKTSSTSGGSGGGSGLKVPFPTMTQLKTTTKMTMPQTHTSINTSALKKIRSPFITIKQPKL